MLASAVGRLIVDLAGLAVLFWVAAAFYAGALLLAGRLREPREMVEPKYGHGRTRINTE